MRTGAAISLDEKIINYNDRRPAAELLEKILEEPENFHMKKIKIMFGRTLTIFKSYSSATNLMNTIGVKVEKNIYNEISLSMFVIVLAKRYGMRVMEEGRNFIRDISGSRESTAAAAAAWGVLF